jgi:hypothetical protein
MVMNHIPLAITELVYVGHMEQHRVNVNIRLHVDPCHLTKYTNPDIPNIEGDALNLFLAPVE